jgi:hypothetical protein
MNRSGVGAAIACVVLGVAIALTEPVRTHGLACVASVWGGLLIGLLTLVRWGLSSPGAKVTHVTDASRPLSSARQ